MEGTENGRGLSGCSSLVTSEEMLFFWLAPLFVDQSGRGHIAGMQYPAIKKKTKTIKLSANIGSS